MININAPKFRNASVAQTSRASRHFSGSNGGGSGKAALADPVCVRFSEEEAERLRELSRDFGLGSAAVVRVAVDLALEVSAGGQSAFDFKPNAS